ncbi:MAG: hypothetical protein IPL46_18645 [Saprospiraceae bacterium]|nr:hypothetical protein [Saprospiraceae bacterium]
MPASRNGYGNKKTSEHRATTVNLEACCELNQFTEKRPLPVNRFLHSYHLPTQHHETVPTLWEDLILPNGMDIPPPIMVTNTTFPVAGDRLRTAIDHSPVGVIITPLDLILSGIFLVCHLRSDQKPYFVVLLKVVPQLHFPAPHFFQ